MVVELPPFDLNGVLPAFRGAATTVGRRSPYQVPLTTLIARFGTSLPRIAILKGYLKHRAALRQLDITRGFQWLGGSFVEDVESTRGRSPGDLDVVTFYVRPEGHRYDVAWDAFVTSRPEVFNPIQTKAQYHCDAYFVSLAPGDPHRLVRMAAYWSDLFSHTRASVRKGLVEIPLDMGDADESAEKALDGAQIAAIAPMVPEDS